MYNKWAAMLHSIGDSEFVYYTIMHLSFLLSADVAVSAQHFK